MRLEAGIRVAEREIRLARSVPFFAALPTPELERVASNLELVRAAAGEVIVRQGDPGDRFFVVAEGEVQVIRDGTPVATAGPGDFFGEIALLRDVRRTATVVARSDVRLYALGRHEFLRAVTGSPGTARGADAVVEERLRPR